MALTGLCAAYTLGMDRWFVEAVPEEIRGRAMSLPDPTGRGEVKRHGERNPLYPELDAELVCRTDARLPARHREADPHARFTADVRREGTANTVTVRAPKNAPHRRTVFPGPAMSIAAPATMGANGANRLTT